MTKEDKISREIIGAAIEVQLMSLKLCMLFNFNVPLLKDGIKRVVLNL